MPLRRARTIDELSELTQDADLVLTADAPLALALNRRAEGARLGTRAATPLNYARRGLEVPGRRELFCTVVRETGIPFKQAATLLDVALACWEDTGDLDNLDAWERYQTPQMEAIVDVLRTEPSGHAARETTQVPADVDVAVVGGEAFSPLDRAVLPDDATEVTWIDPFHPDEVFQLPPFRVHGSTASIIASLREAITPANATDVGIVLDPTGPARPLVESMLDAQGIPYHSETELTQDTELRAFLRLLRLGLTSRGLTGRDVRGLLVALGIHISPRDDQRRLASLTDRGTKQLEAFWREIRGGSLLDAITAFEDLADTSLTDLREEIEPLGVLDDPLDQTLLDSLAFFLDTYTLEDTYTRDGVLLASANANAYVDRPTVFHVGMGTDWAAPPPSYPWIDREHREAVDLARFERLIQSGAPPIYLVQDTRRGQTVTPCFSLHELLEVEFERFTDLPHTRNAPAQPAPESPAANAPGDGFEHAPIEEVQARTIETLSASALDRLAVCPRDWYMDRLVTEPRQAHLEKGTLLHAFAEFYAEHPATVDVDAPDDRERLVEIALEAMRPYVDADDEPVLATELAIGMRNIARWLDQHPPTGDGLAAYQEPPQERQGANRFAEAFDLELDLGLTERWFQDPELGIHGKVDLVHDADHLVDWKTGKRRPSLGRTIRKARVDGGEDEPRFQPAAYLTHHRPHDPGRALAFTFLDVLANHRDVLRGEGDLGDVERRIRYHPHSFEEHLATEAAFEHLITTSQAREDVLGTLGYARYRAYFEKNELPAFEDKRTIVETTFAESFVDLAIEHRGAPSKSEKAALGALKKLVSLREKALFQEDLDTFQAFVSRTLDDVNRWLATRFPVGEADLSDTRHEDLILRHLGPDAPPAHAPDEPEVAPDV